MSVFLSLLVLVACSPQGDTAGDTGAVDTEGDTAGDTADNADDADRDGTTEAEGDCNDGNAAINPLATDIVGDGIDQNCDGVDGLDADGDGHASLSSGGDDCDDADGAVQLGGPWYADADADGYGDDVSSTTGCDAPASYTPTGGDCDDHHADTHPGAAECTADGRDNDCQPSTPDVQGEHPPESVEVACGDGGVYSFEDGDYPTIELSTSWSDEDGDLSTVELFWAWDDVLDGEVSAAPSSTGGIELSGGTCAEGIRTATIRLLVRVDGATVPFDQPVELAASLTDLQGHASDWVIITCTSPSAP